MAIEQTYDHPAHDRVRQHLVALVAAGRTPEELQRLRGLFMPGPLALEIAHLRRVGVDPRKLTGVEWDAERAAAIRSRRPRFRIAVMSLEAYVIGADPARDAIDFVLLDFDGSALTFTNDVVACLRLLRPSSGAVLSVTGHGRRDQRALLDDAVVTLALLNGILAPRQLTMAIDLTVDRLARAMVGGTPEERIRRCLRELAVLTAILRGLAVHAAPEEATTFATAWADAERSVRMALESRHVSAYRNGNPFPIPDTPPSLAEAAQRCRIPLIPERWFRCAFTAPPHVPMQTLAARFQLMRRGESPMSMASVARQAVRDLLLTPIHVFDRHGQSPVVVRCQSCESAAERSIHA